jgi:hypothetical protein
MADIDPELAFDKTLIVTVTPVDANSADPVDFAAVVPHTALVRAAASDLSVRSAQRRVITILPVETDDERSDVATALAVVSEAIIRTARSLSRSPSAEPDTTPSLPGGRSNFPAAPGYETSTYICKLRDMTSVVPVGEHDEQGYKLRISRLTIDTG